MPIIHNSFPSSAKYRIAEAEGPSKGGYSGYAKLALIRVDITDPRWRTPSRKISIGKIQERTQGIEEIIHVIPQTFRGKGTRKSEYRRDLHRLELKLAQLVRDDPDTERDDRKIAEWFIKRYS